MTQTIDTERMIAIGAEVERTQAGDYTEGRIGTVLEIDEVKGRVRVLWHTAGPAQGSYPMCGLVCWVKFSGVVAKG